MSDVDAEIDVEGISDVDNREKLEFILARGWRYSKTKDALTFLDYLKLPRRIVDLTTAYEREKGRDDRGCYPVVNVPSDVMKNIADYVEVVAGVMEITDNDDFNMNDVVDCFSSLFQVLPEALDADRLERIAEMSVMEFMVFYMSKHNLRFTKIPRKIYSKDDGNLFFE